MSEIAEESDNSRFVTWVMGINAVLVVAGITVVGSILWGLSRDVVKLQAGQEAIVNTVTALQSQVAAGTANRYTGDHASADRASIYRAIESLTSRVDAIDTRQRDGLARLGQLEFQVGIKKPGS